MNDAIRTDAAPDLWRRYLGLLVEGLRTRPDALPLPLAAPDDETLHELMGNLHQG